MIAIITGEFTKLILRKCGSKVCVILFGFYSTHYKVYIHLPCINTHQQTTAPFNYTPIISSRYHQTIVLYQGSSHHCEGDHKFDIIMLFHPSHKMHYCNQSVLGIVLDLNIFIFSIMIFDLIFRSALIRMCLLCVRHLYISKGLRFYIFCL